MQPSGLRCPAGASRSPTVHLRHAFTQRTSRRPLHFVPARQWCVPLGSLGVSLTRRSYDQPLTAGHRTRRLADPDAAASRSAFGCMGRWARRRCDHSIPRGGTLPLVTPVAARSMAGCGFASGQPGHVHSDPRQPSHPSGGLTTAGLRTPAGQAVFLPLTSPTSSIMASTAVMSQAAPMTRVTDECFKAIPTNAQIKTRTKAKSLPGEEDQHADNRCHARA